MHQTLSRHWHALKAAWQQYRLCLRHIEYFNDHFDKRLEDRVAEARNPAVFACMTEEDIHEIDVATVNEQTRNDMINAFSLKTTQPYMHVYRNPPCTQPSPSTADQLTDSTSQPSKDSKTQPHP